MKTGTLGAAVAAAVGLFAGGAVAQHEEHHQDQAAPPAQSADTGKMAMMSGSMMPQMMMSQRELGTLTSQLAQSFAAIQQETDPTKLKQKLAEHGLLLKELESKVDGHSKMMEMMRHKMDSEHKQ